MLRGGGGFCAELVTFTVFQELNDVLNDAVTQHDHMLGLHGKDKSSNITLRQNCSGNEEALRSKLPLVYASTCPNNTYTVTWVQLHLVLHFCSPYHVLEKRQEASLSVKPRICSKLVKNT